MQKTRKPNVIDNDHDIDEYDHVHDLESDADSDEEDGSDEDGNSFEKVPRALKQEWEETGPKFSKLPTILPDGQVVMNEVEAEALAEIENKKKESMIPAKALAEAKQRVAAKKGNSVLLCSYLTLKFYITHKKSLFNHIQNRILQMRKSMIVITQNHLLNLSLLILLAPLN